MSIANQGQGQGWGKLRGRVYITIALFGISCLWVCSVSGNVFGWARYGSGAGLPWWSWWVPIVGGIGSDIIKVIGLSLVARNWANQARIAFGAGLAIWTISVGLGSVTVGTFFYAIFTDSAASRTMHNVADNSLSRQLDELLAQQAKAGNLHLDCKGEKECARLGAEIERIGKRIEDLRTRLRSEIGVGAPDPMAAFLHVPAEHVHTGLTLAVTALVELGASFGLFAFIPGSPAQQVIPRFVTVATPRSSNGGGKKGGGAKPAKKPKPAPELPLRQQTLALISLLEEKYGIGTAVSCTAVRNLFAELHKVHAGEWGEMMDSKKLGQQLKILGVDRDGDHYKLPTEREKKEAQKQTPASLRGSG